MKDRYKTKAQLISDLVVLRARGVDLERAAAEADRMADALQIQQARFETLFECSPDAVVMLDRDNRIVRANPGCTVLLGYSSEELTGRCLEEIIGPPTQRVTPTAGGAGAPAALAAARAGVGRRRDGTAVEVSVRRAPIQLDGEPTGACLIIRDVSERRRAEADHRDSLALLATLIEHMRAAVLVEDRDGRVLAANTKFCDTFSLTDRTALIGAPSISSFERWRQTFQDPGRSVTGMEEIRRKGIPIHGEDVRGAEGQVWERDYVPIVSANDCVVGQVWQYRDVTRRRRVEEALRRSDRPWRAEFTLLQAKALAREHALRKCRAEGQYEPLTGEQDIALNRAAARIIETLDEMVTELMTESGGGSEG